MLSGVVGCFNNQKVTFMRAPWQNLVNEEYPKLRMSKVESNLRSSSDNLLNWINKECKGRDVL